MRGGQVRRARLAWRITTMSAPSACSVRTVSMQRLALLDAAAEAADVDHVGAEALGRPARRRRACGCWPRRTVSTTVLPRSVGHLLDRPLAAPPSSRRPCRRTCSISSAAEVVEVEDVAPSRSAAQLARLRDRRPRRAPSISSSSHAHLLASRRARHVLADVVGPDRQLAVAAVDQHGQLDRARAGRSRSARPARRGSVRPVYSTSSTSTTVAPVTSTGMRVGADRAGSAAAAGRRGTA